MELTKKDKIVKYVVYCLVLAVCSLLQNVGGLFLEIGGARCFLLVPVAVLLTIDEDEKVAALIGFFAGLLWDITSVQHMGYNAIFIMLMCFVSSCLVTYAFRDTFMYSMVCAVGATVLYCIVYWLVFVVFAGVSDGVWSVLYFYIPCAVYTGVVTPVFYKLLQPLKKKLNKAYEIQQ